MSDAAAHRVATEAALAGGAVFSSRDGRAGRRTIVKATMQTSLVRTCVVLAPLLASCGGGGGPSGGGGHSGGGNGGNGGNTSTPIARPGERDMLLFVNPGGGLVNANEVIGSRVAVARGDDVILFAPVDGNALGTSDTAAVRVARDGTVVWARRYRFPELAFVGDAVDDGAGVAFVAGQDATVYVVRIDDDGAIRSQRAYDVPGASQISPALPLSLAPLDDHGLLVGTGVSALRLAADDTVVWANNLGGDGGVQRVAALPGGDLAAVGGTGVMRVARFAPDGTPRFIGVGSILGDLTHAGLAPAADGGILVFSGAKGSDELVGIVTAHVAADGKTAALQGIQMTVQNAVGFEAPYVRGAGAHLQRTAGGGVWASFELSIGGVGPHLRDPIVVAFDDGAPTDAVKVALGFAFSSDTIAGIWPEFKQNIFWRTPRPLLGDCVEQPRNLHTQALASAKYALVQDPKVTPVAANPVDAKVTVDELTAGLFDVSCP